MTLAVSHSTPSDGSFSAAGATAWDAQHSLAGTVSVAQGGTGATTLTGILQGSGTSPVAVISDSTVVGQVLRVTGVSIYGWGALDLANTNAVTGTLPTANVANLSGTNTGDQTISDATIMTTDITTNNVTSTKHGFAPKSPADATAFLNGAITPAYAAIKDSDLSTSDITTNDATTLKHGFMMKYPGGTTNFLRADGTFAAPTATAPDISLSILAPSVSETITAGYSAVIVRKYTIASGTKLTVRSAALFRIL